MEIYKIYWCSQLSDARTQQSSLAPYQLNSCPYQLIHFFPVNLGCFLRLSQISSRGKVLVDDNYAVVNKVPPTTTRRHRRCAFTRWKQFNKFLRSCALARLRSDAQRAAQATLFPPPRRSPLLHVARRRPSQPLPTQTAL